MSKIIQKSSKSTKSTKSTKSIKSSKSNNKQEKQDNKINKEDDNLLWIDKYRPRRLKTIVHQEQLMKMLNNTIITGDLPNLLLYGPSGTGKTTTILALAFELFGPNLINDRVLELNASDERGIDTVRDKIIKFAKYAIGNKDPSYPYPVPPYKIIILDEADTMTLEAQAALRKVIESESHITRFCFTCNHIEKIIEPIVSRCVKFRFKPIDKTSMCDRLYAISVLEGMDLKNEIIEKIYDKSEGDARRAIMMLQNLKYLDKITLHNVDIMCGTTSTKDLEYIWKTCINSKISDMYLLAEYVNKKSMKLEDVLIYLKNKILDSKLNSSIKSNLIIEIGNTEMKLIDKADEFLQTLNILCLICNAY